MIGAGTGGQGPPDGADGEEAERCPICLGILAGGELAMPDSCCHVFCLRCLLTWAELQMAPSCPVDRRPFNNVYRWDRILGCVQVPVRKRLPQSDAESCCCRNPEQKACLKSKPIRRLRRQKVERTADAKTKGLVRKCNDEDSSSLSRKKVRGIECCTWSPPPCVSSVTSAQDVADPVWLAEDIPYDTGFKQCKPQVQHCPWLSPAAPIPADGTSRQSLRGTSWNHNPSPFGFVSSPFTSSSPFSPSHFVFQGVVCAITCPKGGEKRGGRASTSKAPTKEAESLPSRRSGRNSKTQEETPASDPATPPQSSLSDSDSSASQSTKLAKTSQVPAKRKGKRVTNRKASGKRKATARKKSSPEVVDSPAASEEEAQEETQEEAQEETQEEAQEETQEEAQEEESDESQNREKEEEEDKTEQELDGTEGSLSDEQDDQEGVGPVKDVGQESEETQEQIDECIQEEKADEGESDVSCPSGSAVSSPGSCSEEVKSNKEAEEQASPVSSGEKHPEKRTSPPPPDSQNALLEDTMSPQCDEQDDKMDICAESEEADNEESSKEVKAESCGSLAQPGSPSAGELDKNVADQEATASAVIVAEMLASLEPSGVDSSVEGSKDDTSVVPMDCSSPMSEHGNSPVLELPNETASPASAEPPPTTSETHVVKEERAKDKRERERSQERKNGKQRRSRFHSPTSTWSPKRDSKRETSRRSRSRSRERDGSPPSRRSSRTRSRERDRDRDGERDYSRRDRSRERRRRRSRSRSWSRSRSRSRSRTRSHRRGPSPEWSVSRDQSPQRKERRGGWRSGPGGGSGSEGRRYHGGAGHFENGVPTESSPDRHGSSDNPDWVTEKIRGEADGRNRDFGYSGSSRWEDRSGNRGEPRGRGGRGGFERGRGGGRGSGNRSFYNQQEEMSDNRWHSRNNFSGTGNNSGNDAYSRFNENRGGGRRKESEPGEPMLDRSGWSSASSWAVRRTLPADVQDYYSKRERGPGSWNRQEEEQQQQPPPAAADPPKSDPPLQAVPGNAPVPLMNVIPPQLNVLHHYPMQGSRGALPVSLQPAAPYAMPPQVPIHLHPAVPLLQVPAVGAQGLPPPPPPPPPMQQGSQTAAVQPDGHAAQMPNTMVSFVKPALLPNPTKAGVAAVTQGQPAPSQALPSSTTQPGQHNKAQADSSKKEKKQQIQEKAINEVKTAIKPFYQKKEITKEEYKEIVRKAVEKVCHSKSGEVNSGKVANLVKAYVDKYKHARKK